MGAATWPKHPRPIALTLLLRESPATVSLVTMVTLSCLLIVTAINPLPLWTRTGGAPMMKRLIISKSGQHAKPFHRLRAQRPSLCLFR